MVFPNAIQVAELGATTPVLTSHSTFIKVLGLDGPHRPPPGFGGGLSHTRRPHTLVTYLTLVFAMIQQLVKSRCCHIAHKVQHTRKGGRAPLNIRSFRPPLLAILRTETEPGMPLPLATSIIVFAAFSQVQAQCSQLGEICGCFQALHDLCGNRDLGCCSARACWHVSSGYKYIRRSDACFARTTIMMPRPGHKYLLRRR